MATLMENKAKLLRAFEPGKLVLVVGWDSTFHNAFTESLPRETVRFAKDRPGSIAENVCVVITTRLVDRAQASTLRQRFSGEMIVNLKAGEVKALLKACGDTLLTISHRTPRPETQEAPPTIPLEEIAPMSERYIRNEERIMSLEQRFTHAFLRETNNDRNASLSRNAVAKLRAEVFGNNTKNIKQLIAGGWLEPVVTDKRVGAYKAGPRMIEVPKKSPEPDDPVERARFLIRQKGELVERKAAIAEELVRIDANLKKITEAEQLMLQLEALMKKT